MVNFHRTDIGERKDVALLRFFVPEVDHPLELVRILLGQVDRLGAILIRSVIVPWNGLAIEKSFTFFSRTGKRIAAWR